MTTNTIAELEAQLGERLKALRLNQNLDQITLADRFAIGTAKSVIFRVRKAITEWPDFAGQAGLSKTLLEDIQKQHLPLD